MSHLHNIYIKTRLCLYKTRPYFCNMLDTNSLSNNRLFVLLKKRFNSEKVFERQLLWSHPALIFVTLRSFLGWVGFSNKLEFFGRCPTLSKAPQLILYIVVTYTVHTYAQHTPSRTFMEGKKSWRFRLPARSRGLGRGWLLLFSLF